MQKRHRQSQGGGQAAPGSRPAGLHAGDRRIGRRPERVLQVRGRLFPRPRRRSATSITRSAMPGFSADRRPVPAGHFLRPRPLRAQKKRRAEIYVEATNAALNGIPAGKVRFHTCYGINEGPRLYEAALADIIDYVLKINAGSFSFEAANPRHEHEYHLFERVKIAGGQGALPRHDHPCQQHRRAPGADRRAHFSLMLSWLAGKTSSPPRIAASPRRLCIRPRCTTPWCGRNSRRCGKAPISRQNSYGISPAGRNESGLLFAQSGLR